MIDVKDMFSRQAEWQRSLARLSWGEKLRISAIMGKAALDLRKHRSTSGMDGANAVGLRGRNK